MKAGLAKEFQAETPELVMSFISFASYFVTYVSIKSHRENHRLFFGKLILSLLSKNFNFDSLITHTLINTISWPEVEVLFRQFTTPQIYQHWATGHIVVVNISPVQQQSSTEQEIILNRNSSSLTLLISFIVPRILNAFTHVTCPPEALHFSVIKALSSAL